MRTVRILQLRYLQTLNSISAENNSTIIFPVPVDIISQLIGKVAAQNIKSSKYVSILGQLRNNMKISEYILL